MKKNACPLKIIVSTISTQILRSFFVPTSYKAVKAHNTNVASPWQTGQQGIKTEQQHKRWEEKDTYNTEQTHHPTPSAQTARATEAHNPKLHPTK